MFLLKGRWSLLIRRIEKSSKSGAWLQNERYSFMAESSSLLTFFPKFVNNAITSARWNFVFKCKRVTNFALSLKNKPDIASREFIFHYTINSYLVCIWRDNLPKYGKLKSILYKNSYPRDLVDRYIKELWVKILAPKPVISSVPKKT